MKKAIFIILASVMLVGCSKETTTNNSNVSNSDVSNSNVSNSDVSNSDVSNSDIEEKSPDSILESMCDVDSLTLEQLGKILLGIRELGYIYEEKQEYFLYDVKNMYIPPAADLTEEEAEFLRDTTIEYLNVCLSGDMAIQVKSVVQRLIDNIDVVDAADVAEHDVAVAKVELVRMESATEIVVTENGVERTIKLAGVTFPDISDYPVDLNDEEKAFVQGVLDKLEEEAIEKAKSILKFNSVSFLSYLQSANEENSYYVWQSSPSGFTPVTGAARKYMLNAAFLDAGLVSIALESEGTYNDQLSSIEAQQTNYALYLFYEGVLHY